MVIIGKIGLSKTKVVEGMKVEWWRKNGVGKEYGSYTVVMEYCLGFSTVQVLQFTRIVL